MKETLLALWLVESSLARELRLCISVYFAARRARVRWDSRRTRLCERLGVIGDIGYRAHPPDPS